MTPEEHLEARTECVVCRRLLVPPPTRLSEELCDVCRERALVLADFYIWENEK